MTSPWRNTNPQTKKDQHGLTSVHCHSNDLWFSNVSHRPTWPTTFHPRAKICVFHGLQSWPSCFTSTSFTGVTQVWCPKKACSSICSAESLGTWDEHMKFADWFPVHSFVTFVHYHNQTISTSTINPHPGDPYWCRRWWWRSAPNMNSGCWLNPPYIIPSPYIKHPNCKPSCWIYSWLGAPKIGVVFNITLW